MRDEDHQADEQTSTERHEATGSDAGGDTRAGKRIRRARARERWEAQGEHVRETGEGE